LIQTVEIILVVKMLAEFLSGGKGRLNYCGEENINQMKRYRA